MRKCHTRDFMQGKRLGDNCGPLKLEFWSMASKTFDKKQKNSVTSSLGTSLKKIN